VRDISKKLVKHHFYISKVDDWDRSLSNQLDIFIEIFSAIGTKETE
jgi:hypothetical protein